MQRPHIHIVCSPPCVAVWRAVALYALENDTYTAVQFEDCVDSLRQKTGHSFVKLLKDPYTAAALNYEFTNFLEAGLELNENMIVTGPVWCPDERKKILLKTPDFYHITAWTVDNVNAMDAVSFNTAHRPKDKQWPMEELARILSLFTPPTLEEGFDEIQFMKTEGDLGPDTKSVKVA